jgi:hypothetical protein
VRDPTHGSFASDEQRAEWATLAAPGSALGRYARKRR